MAAFHKPLLTNRRQPMCLSLRCNIITFQEYIKACRPLSEVATPKQVLSYEDKIGRCLNLPSLLFKGFSACYVVEERRQSYPVDDDERPESMTKFIDAKYMALRLAEKMGRDKSERFTYLIAAVVSSFGITSMSIMAVYYRFSWQMESHHKTREGAFYLNDVFAKVNDVPAIALLSYGFFNKGLIPRLCFGAEPGSLLRLLRFLEGH